VAAWAALIYSGSIATIWPMFGVANQLLAALALSIGTSVLIRMGKDRYTPITLIPMVFMFVLTLTASWELVIRFSRQIRLNPAEALTYKLDIILVSVMALLAAMILVDSLIKWIRHFSGAANDPFKTALQAKQR
jgi:carbon starvation protein